MFTYLQLHILAVAIALPPGFNDLIMPIILLLVGGLASYSFRWIEAASLWLQRTKPIIRFIFSGVWGGLAGWLTLALAIMVPTDFGQMDAATWGKLLAALATWAWHAFLKAKEKSTQATT